jgi:hypothetical protein
VTIPAEHLLAFAKSTLYEQLFSQKEKHPVDLAYHHLSSKTGLQARGMGEHWPSRQKAPGFNLFIAKMNK